MLGEDIMNTQATNGSFSSPRDYRVQSQQSHHRVNTVHSSGNGNTKQKLPFIKIN